MLMEIYLSEEKAKKNNIDLESCYQKINSYQNGSLYEKKNVYPIGYSMTNLLSYRDYEKLSFISVTAFALAIFSSILFFTSSLFSSLSTSIIM